MGTVGTTVVGERKVTCPGTHGECSMPPVDSSTNKNSKPHVRQESSSLS
jgi:hypothetical protein